MLLFIGNLVDGVVANDLIANYNNYSSTNLNANANAAVVNPIEMSSMVQDKEAEGSLSGSTHIGIAKQPMGRYVLGSGNAIKNSSKTTSNYDYFPYHFNMHSRKMNEFNRVVIGLTFFFVSCLSVILGASYPVWIVPCLVVFFFLGKILLLYCVHGFMIFIVMCNDCH